MGAGGDRGELADVGLAVVAAEALQGAGVGAGEPELRSSALAAIAPGGPELAAVAEADRVRALAVERRLQWLAEARCGQGQLEGREVLDREVPAAGWQLQGL